MGMDMGIGTGQSLVMVLGLIASNWVTKERREENPGPAGRVNRRYNCQMDKRKGRPKAWTGG